ncbi:MAG: ABC transporter C-terminal domain-containing protein, partial [Bacteroidota bacterium]
EYPGTYKEYDYWQSQRVANQPLVQEKKVSAPKPKKKESTPHSSDAQRALQRDLKKQQQELEAIETTIGSLESEKKAVEEQLANPSVFGNVERLAEETEKFEQLEKQLNEANQQWENLALKIEEIEDQLNND